MPIPQAILDLTAGCEAFVADFIAKQADYKLTHREGKFWRGSSEDPADFSRVRVLVEVPDGVDEFGNPKSRREYQPGATMLEVRGAVGLPASVAVDVSEYQGPNGVGWFVKFTAKPGGGFTLTLDGAGAETYGGDWVEE
jgi:hypothetical protein